MVRIVGRIKPPVAEKTTAKLAKEPGMHAVGGVPGLYLRVSDPPTARSWIIRYSFDGRRRDMGLGSYGEMTLEEAREAAREKRKLIRQGIDPLDDRRSARIANRLARLKALTFDECAEAFLHDNEAGWKSSKHAQQWRNTLKTYASPIVGALPVKEIDVALVLQILRPIWGVKTETASRVRSRVEQILDWAAVNGYRDRNVENPARWRGNLDKALPRRSKVQKVEHHAALPYVEIAPFMVELRKVEGMGARALEFAILTACRSGEVRGATWSEIDFGARMWVIPPTRMKAGREHRVPLSDAAIALLEKIPRFGESGIIFQGMRGGQLSDATMTATLKRMGRSDLTGHGFRSTFRDWAAEQTAYPHEVCEMALAHVVSDKTEKAYRRGDLFQKRVGIMRDWAAYCNDTKPKGEIADMAEARAKKRKTKAA